MHHTKDKGDLACALAVADLTRKGYSVFSPLVTEHLPFDLAAYVDGKFLRIQCKHSSAGKVANVSKWTGKDGSHSHLYSITDFDYYAVYLPSVDTVVYVPSILGGITIATDVPNHISPIYWYEDFLDITEQIPDKRSYYEFGDHIQPKALNNLPVSSRKVVWPTAEELQILVQSKPVTEIALQYGVSDKAVHKWIERYSIQKQPKGHWLKSGAE